MKVQVHPADSGGCGWYRLRHPARALQDQGHDVTVAETMTTVNQDIGGRVRVNDVLTDADVVVLQRPLLRTTFEMIAPLRRRGVAVVVEVDDDFHSIPDGHTCKRPGVWNPERSPRWLKRACEDADLVTVTTPALAARYGGHGRVHVLPNMVPERYLQLGRPRDPERTPVVGWTGSVATHVGDLEVTGGGVADALRATGARFNVVGTGMGVKDGLGLDEHPSTTAGWVSLEDYPVAYAELDVAIVPLVLNPFNEAKSDLKGVEAAALGVPAVASPTGPYCALANQGACLLASERTGWRVQLTKLIREPHLRAAFAAQGRAYVAEHRTIERQAWRWLEAWDRARQLAAPRAA